MRKIIVHVSKLIICGLVTTLLTILFSSRIPVAQSAFPLDWANLRNPVMQFDNWSIKDFAAAYKNGTWYIFFSAFYDDNGQLRCHVAEVSTIDFKTYSQPVLKFDGQEEGWIGMCSPNITQVDSTYYLTFNSWGDKPSQFNQLFYKTSTDLVNWSTGYSNLGSNLTSGKRAIDAAVAFENNKFYLIWKEGKGKKSRTRLAVARSMNANFAYIGNGYPRLHMASGLHSRRTHENFEFIKVDGKWRLLSTDYSPHNPYLYTMHESGDNSDWLTWVGGYKLEIPKERFNTAHRANAAVLYDWRAYDGYFYLLYAGNTENSSFGKRGHNRLGLARSLDLVKWTVIGTLPEAMPEPYHAS